jgi:hypothetical protein
MVKSVKTYPPNFKKGAKKKWKKNKGLLGHGIKNRGFKGISSKKNSIYSINEFDIDYQSAYTSGKIETEG